MGNKMELSSFVWAPIKGEYWHFKVKQQGLVASTEGQIYFACFAFAHLLSLLQKMLRYWRKDSNTWLFI